MYIDRSKNRFLGNLHCHSDRSDGKSSVAELVNGYKEEGYHFLALTDHRRVYGKKDYDTNDFILIPAMEMDTWIEPNPTHKFFHFGVLGNLEHDFQLDTPIFKDYGESMMPYNDFSEHLRIVNHPYWSRMTVTDLIKVKPKIIEIYNHSAEVKNGCGFDLNTWDQLLYQGHKVLGVATDDNHMKIDKKETEKDYYGGLIVVLSDELTVETILSSISNGEFYSKMGPKAPDFLEIRVENKQVFVETTDVVNIKFIAYNYHGKVDYAKDGSINSATFEASGHKFVRVEIEDENGLKAWSNPIYF